MSFMHTAAPQLSVQEKNLRVLLLTGMELADIENLQLNMQEHRREMEGADVDTLRQKFLEKEISWHLACISQKIWDT